MTAATVETTRTTPWTLDESLADDADVAQYLDAIIEEGDEKMLLDALGLIARRHGMTDLARKTGLSRESLYRALSASGDPQFSTMIKVISALGLRLRFIAA